MNGRALMLSLKPRYAEMIFGGKKTAELRRVRPSVSRGDLLILYVSSPTKALAGVAEVASVVSGKPDEIWPLVSRRAGIGRDEFDRYFAGAGLAHAILLSRVWKMGMPMKLDRIRRMRTRFRPPQSYLYVTADDILHPRAPRSLVGPQESLSSVPTSTSEKPHCRGRRGSVSGGGDGNVTAGS